MARNATRLETPRKAHLIHDPPRAVFTVRSGFMSANSRAPINPRVFR
jgi:hypothetical protein